VIGVATLLRGLLIDSQGSFSGLTPNILKRYKKSMLKKRGQAPGAQTTPFCFRLLTESFTILPAKLFKGRFLMSTKQT